MPLNTPRRYPRWPARSRPKRTWLSWWHDWGPHVNTFSQLGLFALGLLGLFYVVLPVYQKSVLEEAVAKLQIEARVTSDALTAKQAALSEASTRLAAIERERVDATQALEATYHELRSYAVGRFVQLAGAECSGLLILPEPPAEGKPRSVLASAYKLVSVEPGRCLREQLRSAPLGRHLRSDDLKLLTERATQVAEDLDVKHRAVKKTLGELEGKARADPTILSKLGSDFLYRLLEASYPPGPKRDEEIFRTRLGRTGTRIAFDFERDVRKAIDSLRSIAWPKPIAKANGKLAAP